MTVSAQTKEQSTVSGERKNRLAGRQVLERGGLTDVTVVLVASDTTHECVGLQERIRCAAEWAAGAFASFQIMVVTPDGVFELADGDNGWPFGDVAGELVSESSSEIGHNLLPLGRAEVGDARSAVNAGGPPLWVLLEHARHPWLLFIRLDTPLVWQDLELLPALVHDYAVVSGYRVDRASGGRGWRRLIGRSVRAFCARLLFGIPLRDWPPPALLIDRSVFEPVSGGWDWSATIVEALDLEICSALAIAQPAVAEVPVRTAGSTAPEVGSAGVGHVAADVSSPRRSAVAAVREGLASYGRLVRYWWNTLLFPGELPAGEDVSGPPAASGSASTNVGLQEQCRYVLKSWGPVVSLVLLAGLVLLPHLSYPFVEPDETRNAQIALEMYRSGDWVCPTRLGRPYMDKPPMLFWCVASSYHLFGPSPWAARLPIALAGLLTVLVTYWLGCQLLERRAAWIGGLVLTSSIGFVLPARFLIHDALLTLFVTAVWWLLWLGTAETEVIRRRLLWAAAGGLCGLGILTKGPVSVVLTVPPLLALRWLRPDRVRVTASDWIVFVLAAALCAGPWYVAASVRNEHFFEYFVWRQNISRFLSGSNHPAPWWFYIPVVFAGLFPASLLLPALVVYLCARSRGLAQSRHWGLSYPALAAGWTLLFFTLSEGKLPTYVLPAAPMLALLIGHLVHVVCLPGGLLQRRAASRYLRDVRRQAPLVLLLLAAVSGVVGGLVDWVLRPDAAVGVAASIAVAVVCGVAAWWCGWRGRCRTSARWAVAAMAAVLAVSNVFNDIFPDAAAYRSYLLEAAEGAASQPGLLTDRTVPLVFFGRDRDSWEYYFPGHSAIELQGEELGKLTEFLRQQPRALVVAEPHNIRRAMEVLDTQLKVRPLSDCVLLVEQVPSDEARRPDSSQ